MSLIDAYHHLQARRFADCLRLVEPLVAAAPGAVEPALILGLALAAEGEAVRAALLLNRVARLRPAHAHPATDLAPLLRGTGRAHRIETLFRACLALTPDDVALRHHLAAHLTSRGDPALALAELALTAGLPLDAGRRVQQENLRGVALAGLGDLPAAEAAFRQVTAWDPRNPLGWSNLGLTAKAGQRYDEALAAHRQAITLRPDDVRLRINQACTLLAAGRYEQGWAEYEWRLALPGHTTLPRQTLLPELDRLASLAGRTILVTHDEGFGDTLQFIRYLPRLAATGARLIAALPPALHHLVRSSRRLLAPHLEIVDADGPLPAFDWHCPLQSLPRVCRTTVATIPAVVPYLAADPALIAAWSRRLPPARAGRRRVGLVWSGQSRPWLPDFATIHRQRSIPAAELGALANLDTVDFVSLQLGASAAQPTPAGLTLLSPGAEIGDFADTAAIMQSLDLVVSVDTATVHLAAALGRPTILLDRYDPCWRWLAPRLDSPWYPTVRIIRQSRPGDWQTSLADLARVLGTQNGTGARTPMP